MKKPRTQYWAAAKIALQVLVAGAILFFLARNVYKDWAGLSGSGWRLRWPPLVASCAALLVAELLLGLCWHVNLRLLGERPTLWASFLGLYPGQLAKYVPGKVVTLLVRLRLMRRGGVREESTTAAQVIDATASWVSALIVGGLCAALTPHAAEQSGAMRVLWLLVLVPIGLVVVHPRVLAWVLDRLARRLGRPTVRFDMPYAGLLAVFGIYVATWASFGVGLALLCESFTGLRTSPALGISAYTLSWVAGFFAFMLPGGLGLRELTLAALLGISLASRPTGQTEAQALALAARLWVTAAEVLFAGAAWACWLAWQRRAAADESGGGEATEAPPKAVGQP